jgi:hypothetical protein
VKQSGEETGRGTSREVGSELARDGRRGRVVKRRETMEETGSGGRNERWWKRRDADGKK